MIWKDSQYAGTRSVTLASSDDKDAALSKHQIGHTADETIFEDSTHQALKAVGIFDNFITKMKKKYVV